MDKMTTHDENNRLIGEHFEPFATLPQSSELGVLDDLIRSPKGFWYYFRDEEHEWTPCNFYHDEAANAQVLEALPASQISFNPEMKVWTVLADAWNHGYTFIENHDRRTAICEAAVKWIKQEKTNAGR